MLCQKTAWRYEPSCAVTESIKQPAIQGDIVAKNGVRMRASTVVKDERTKYP